jgi:HEPN domain-containing protein
MQRDPEWVAEVTEWLDKSDEDLRVARIILQADTSLAAAALYHCQQATEKALKGFLVWHGQVIRKTHDLESIGQEVLVIDPTLASIVADAVPLTTFAWLTRYPGAGLIPDQQMAARGLRTAEAVIAAIRQRIVP